MDIYTRAEMMLPINRFGLRLTVDDIGPGEIGGSEFDKLFTASSPANRIIFVVHRRRGETEWGVAVKLDRFTTGSVSGLPDKRAAVYAGCEIILGMRRPEKAERYTNC